MAKDYTFEKRKYILGAIVVCIVLIYILRLAGLQIFSDKYKRYADSNAFLNKIQYPSRGAIYDRNGKLLVFNQPAYDITFIPREVTQLDTLDFAAHWESHANSSCNAWKKSATSVKIRATPNTPPKCL